MTLKNTVRQEAVDWLRNQLNDQGWVEQVDALYQSSFSKRTIYRAKDALGLVSAKLDSGTTIWRKQTVEELTKRPEFLELFERFVLAHEALAQTSVAHKAVEQAPKPETTWRKIVKHLSDINLAIDVNSDDRDSPSLLLAEARKAFPGVPDDGEFGIYTAVDKVRGI